MYFFIIYIISKYTIIIFSIETSSYEINNTIIKYTLTFTWKSNIICIQFF